MKKILSLLAILFFLNSAFADAVVTYQFVDTGNLNPVSLLIDNVGPWTGNTSVGGGFVVQSQSNGSIVGAPNTGYIYYDLNTHVSTPITPLAQSGIAVTFDWTPLIGGYPGNSTFYSQGTGNGIAISGSITNAQIDLNGMGANFVTTTATTSANAVPTTQGVYPCPAEVTDWWPGNNNGNDVIGGYTVTANNGSEGYGSGVVSQAFTFTGGGNYYAAPSANWNFGTSDFTIEMWANFASTGGNQAFIACDNGGGSNNKWFFAYDIFGNGGLVFYNEIGSSVYYITAGTFVPTANTWYHIAVTRHVNTWTFYVNGSAIGSTSFSGAVAGVSANLTIGEGNPNDGFAFNGSLDEVSMYNAALTSNQIAGIYNAGIFGKSVLPVIITQPQSLDASNGSTVNFNVSAIAYSSLQWLFNNTPINNGGIVSGATTTNLTLTGITALNNGYYSLALTASGGSITSSVVSLNELNCYPEPAGIVAWYPGEGNANDTYGGYNGSFSGSYVAGEVGRAFNINSGSVSIANNSWMYNLGSGNFTIEMWVYFSNPNQADEAMISCDVGGGSNPKWMFVYGHTQGGDDLNSLSMVSGNGGTTIGNAHFVPNAYQWYHIAVTYAASSGTYDFYANGILLQSVTSQPAIQNVNATMYFGQAEGGYNFTGYEDEVTFYTNTLSQVQLQAIYSAGSIGKCDYFAPASSSKAPFYLMLQN